MTPHCPEDPSVMPLACTIARSRRSLPPSRRTSAPACVAFDEPGPLLCDRVGHLAVVRVADVAAEHDARRDLVLLEDARSAGAGLLARGLTAGEKHAPATAL